MYAKILNNQIEKYPYTIAELRLDNPNTSFPVQPSEEVLTQFNVVKIIPTDKPRVDSNLQWVKEDLPILISDQWTQTWTIVDYDIEQKQTIKEQQATRIRNERNTLLEKSDWTQITDVNLSNKNEWIIYRQELRNITLQPGFPFEIVWPTAPQ